MALKLPCVNECLQKWLAKSLKKRNLTTISLIPIPQNGQSNTGLSQWVKQNHNGRVLSQVSFEIVSSTD